MPNWCQNELAVYGPKDQVKEVYQLLVDELEDDKISVTFDRLIPMPKILLKVQRGFNRIDGKDVRAWIEEGEWPNTTARLPDEGEQLLIDAIGYPDWYEWAIANWGTKWDATEAKILRPLTEYNDEAEFAVTFDTAWSPPEPVINTLQERFEKLSIGSFFREDGMQIAGWL